ALAGFNQRIFQIQTALVSRWLSAVIAWIDVVRCVRCAGVINVVAATSALCILHHVDAFLERFGFVLAQVIVFFELRQPGILAVMFAKLFLMLIHILGDAFQLLFPARLYTGLALAGFNQRIFQIQATLVGG